ncbi:unnamed protein product [Anisakis simplex]|uniref:Protein doublesex (inferred by orthology to a D. melanogaster protein) n=1 Tax=Anisakis simplex TaxID=6269 RepID=A0A0M3K541_ANISI|nr:unnamed protein product [Anisakis simplex]
MTQIGFYTANPLACTAAHGYPSLASYHHLMDSHTVSYTKRVPNCQKCGQHGRKSRLKGHKRICPYRDCNCAKCQVVSERQKLMADQIKIRRRQRKDTLMNITHKQLQQTMHQPPSSFVSSSSPTGSVTESNSYSPTSSINNTFTPSPPDVLKAAVSAQTAASSAIPTSLAQLPSLLFHAAPAVSAASLGASTAGRALPGAVATATATNGAAASCFSSLIDSLNNATAPIAMPVAINPSLLSAAAACSSSSSTSAAAVHAVQQAAAHSNHPLMNLSSMIDNEQLLQSLLNNVRLLEQKMCSIEKQSHDETNAASSAFVDVCSV